MATGKRRRASAKHPGAKHPGGKRAGAKRAPRSAPAAALPAWHALTDVGRVRENNEDAVAVDAARGIAVLADGMGGYNAGEVASAMAVTLVGSALAQWLDRAQAAGPQEIAHAMQLCVEHANRSIFQSSCAHAAYAGMGTTLVAAVLRGPMLVLGHIGDSRAYRLRHGALTQLTRDHTLVQEQLDLGLISEEEAATSVHRSLLTRALGVQEEVPLDVQTQSVLPGDLYLLCSDGLTGALTDAEITAVLVGDAPLPAQAQTLLDLANAQGGYDNITLALCRMPD